MQSCSSVNGSDLLCGSETFQHIVFPKHVGSLKNNFRVSSPLLDSSAVFLGPPLVGGSLPPIAWEVEGEVEGGEEKTLLAPNNLFLFSPLLLTLNRKKKNPHKSVGASFDFFKSQLY